MGLLSLQLLAEIILSREPSPGARAQAFGAKSSAGGTHRCGGTKDKSINFLGRRGSACHTGCDGDGQEGGPAGQAPRRPPGTRPSPAGTEGALGSEEGRRGHDHTDESGEGHSVPSEHGADAGAGMSPSAGGDRLPPCQDTQHQLRRAVCRRTLNLTSV